MIEVRDLSVGYSNPANIPDIFEHSDDYDSPEIVLRNISLKFESGKVYGLIGRNGAGKTTLLNCISGLIWRPSYGGLPRKKYSWTECRYPTEIRI